MLKNILYGIALILLIAAIYFAYIWYQSEPDNREILPTLLSFSSSLIMGFIARRKDNDSIRVGKISESTVDIDPKANTDISVKGVRKNSKVLIGKGKDTLKNNS